MLDSLDRTSRHGINQHLALVAAGQKETPNFGRENLPDSVMEPCHSQNSTLQANLEVPKEKQKDSCHPYKVQGLKLSSLAL